MNGGSTRIRNVRTYLLIAMLGALFAVIIYPIWKLEGRWFVVIILAIGLCSISMAFISRFSDYLMLGMISAVPLAGFSKWLFLDSFPKEIKSVAVPSGAIGIGITDFLLAGLYLTWLVRIFVTRTAPVPRFEGIDWLVVMLIAAYMFSLPGTRYLSLGLFSLEHLVKHAMIYFYLSRNLTETNVKWFIISLFIFILGEALLGIFQNQTGLLRGLILDKGAGGAALDTQYGVPGIKDRTRATGTLIDSHSLAAYFAMTLPFPLVFMFTRSISRKMRFFCAIVLIVGLVGLVVTYSRSGWLSCFISLIMALAIYLMIWRERHILPSVLALAVAAALPAVWVVDFIIERFTSAPAALLTARFDQYFVALDVWSDHILFGFGVGNYMLALEDYNFNWALELPVHNVLLWVGAESGLFGVIAFFGIVIAAAMRLYRLLRAHRDPTCRIALALFTGLAAYMLDSLTNPLFREPTVYLMFWFIVALSVALPRLEREGLMHWPTSPEREAVPR